MSPLKERTLDGRTEGYPAHAGSADEPAMEPSTPKAPAQGPPPRPARAPATVADITRPSRAMVREYDHVAAAAYLMKHAGSAALVVLATIPAAMSIRDPARTMVAEGFRQLPVTDGTGWIGIVDIADICNALLGPKRR